MAWATYSKIGSRETQACRIAGTAACPLARTLTLVGLALTCSGHLHRHRAELQGAADGHAAATADPGNPSHCRGSRVETAARLQHKLDDGMVGRQDMKLILTCADGSVIYASAGIPVHHRVIDMI